MNMPNGQDYVGAGTADEPGAFGTSESGVSRLRRTLVNSALTAPIRRAWSGLGSCLMYHRICTEGSGSDGSFAPNRELMVRESEFDAQMRHLAANYNCVSLPDAVELLKKGKLPRRSVIVTFDDGYLDNLTLALPILKTYGIPATLYVTTGIVEKSTNLWWYELESLIGREDRFDFRFNQKPRAQQESGHGKKLARFNRLSQMLKRMTPEDQHQFLEQLRNWSSMPTFSFRGHVLDRFQVKQLSDEPLMTIGAHTHNHSVLSNLDESQLRCEVETSRSLLEQWTGRPVSHLAYPFGGRDQARRREFRVAEELGYASATTTRLGHIHAHHSRKLHALPRIAIGYSDTMTSFKWKLSGLECLMRQPLARVLT